MAHLEPSELARKLPEGTVTFLFTDVEGSTRLARRLGERYGATLRLHQELLRAALTAHEGLEMDTQGDSFFFAFVRARNALAAAVAGQRALAQAEWPEDAPVLVRMGMHTGEPSVSDNRYLGLGVHRAARICAAGHGGQIVLSPATVAVLSDDELADVELRDLGEYVLKDFDEPQRLYQTVVPELPADFPPLRAEPANPPGPRWRSRPVVLAAVAVVVVVGVALGLVLPGGSGVPAAKAAPTPTLPGAANCPIFPGSVWNQRVDKLPVAKNSAGIIRSIGRNLPLHPDFGSGNLGGGPIGIPYNIVTAKTPRAQVPFQYRSESDKGPYPLTPQTKVEFGGGRHAIMVDRSSCTLYELFDLTGSRAGSGAIWNLESNKLRPFGWTSADPAGLPILPGLVRWDEVRKGQIDHALRFTVPRSRNSFVYPARHAVGTSDDPNLPPMGLRVRLKASVDINGFPRQARVILEALKRYGMLVADNGTSWYVSGAPNRHWSNEELGALHTIKGSDFEVVDTRSLHP
jgi:class 3 adenylate cyclase